MCAVCRDYNPPMHLLQNEWVSILKTHCMEAERAKFDLDDSAPRYVCSRHFKEGTPTHIPAGKGLDYLRKEFCGPSWLPTGSNLGLSRPGKRASTTEAESATSAKKLYFSDSNDTQVHSYDKSVPNAVSTDHSAEQQSLDSSLDLLPDLLQKLAQYGTSKQADRMISMISSSEFGSEFVVAAVGLVVACQKYHLSPHSSSRPLLKGALDALDTLKVEVEDRELSYMAEVSTKTVKRARLERAEVRRNSRPFTRLYVIFLTERVQEHTATTDFDDTAIEETPENEHGEKQYRPRKSKHSPHNRELIKGSLQNDLSDWSDDNAPIKSGSMDHSSLNFSTNAEAYKAYVADMRRDGKAFYSFSGFCAVLYRWSIKPTKWDKYSCPLCFLLYHTGKNVMEMENSWHSIEKDVIWSIYHDDITKLKDQTAKFVLIIMDYCRIHELGYVSQVTDEDNSKLSILNFTVVLPGNKEYHFDFFANGKQGYDFMRVSVTHLAQKLTGLTKSKLIYLWSDGGLRTYGTVVNVNHLATLTNTSIRYTFFPRYHGHSRCDAHFGRGKMLLRNKYPMGGLDQVVQVLSAFNDLDDTFCERISFENTTKDGTWKPIWGIRDVQQIRFQEGTVFAKTLPKLYECDDREGWDMVTLPQWYSKKAAKKPDDHAQPTPASSSSSPKQKNTSAPLSPTDHPIPSPNWPGPGKRFTKSDTPGWKNYNAPRYFEILVLRHYFWTDSY